MIPFAIPAAGKIASAIGIKGFALIGAGLVIAFIWWRADVISGQRDRALERVYAEQAAHGVTKASLAELEKTLARLMTEARAREAALENSRKLAAREAQEHERAARASMGQIERLRALAAAGGACAVPEGLSDALEGL